MALKNPYELAGHCRNAVDHHPEVAAAGDDLIEPHFPNCRCAWVNQARRCPPEQLKDLQSRRCWNHELAIRTQQALAFQPLDDFSTRGRGADPLSLLEALA